MMRRAHLVLAAFGILTVTACKKGDSSDDSTAKPVVAAQTIVVQPQAFTETLGAIGTVVSRAGHSATLSAPAAGRVTQIYVTTGQLVQAGQPLIELDQAPFQAALKSAETALAAAEKSAERQERLANEGIVPKKDAESAAADAAKAKSDEVAARRVAEQSVIRAPIAGVVTRMAATMGAQADPSQSLVDIADPRALDILLSLTPTDAARVHQGMRVTLSAGQDASGEPLGVGAITEVAGTVDSTTRGVAIRAEAPTTRRPLRIGETVFGAIAVSTRANAIVVPTDAVVPEGDEFHVFVVDPSQIAHERPVKVGGKTASQIEIVDGLKAGERIVTTGAYGVQDSAKVAPPGTLPSSDDDKAEADSSKGGKSEGADSAKGEGADTAKAKAAPKPAAPAAAKPAAKTSKP